MLAKIINQAKIVSMKESKESYEPGRCVKCPQGMKQGWLKRLIKGDIALDLTCPGPEYLFAAGIVETDKQNARSSMSILKVAVCAKKVTPEMRESSANFERLVKERHAESEAEAENAWANMTEEQQQASLDAPVCIIN